jgi:CheY-like chemotaxis protein
MKRFGVLVAEDDDGDFFILQRALKKAQFKHPVFRATNGQETVDYLAGVTPYSDRLAYPLPSLLLLDLKMPLKHGFDVLRWIRTQAPATVRLLPTLVLSSSSRVDDVELAYQLGANAFLTKPTTIESMVQTVRAIEDFWVAQNCFSDRRASI